MLWRKDSADSGLCWKLHKNLYYHLSDLTSSRSSLPHHLCNKVSWLKLWASCVVCKSLGSSRCVTIDSAYWRNWAGCLSFPLVAALFDLQQFFKTWISKNFSFILNKYLSFYLQRPQYLHLAVDILINNLSVLFALWVQWEKLYK